MTNTTLKCLPVKPISFPIHRVRILLFVLVALSISHIASSQTVYITRTGAKYHDDGCRYLSRSKIETTLKEAKENDYTACSVCKPTTNVSKDQSRIITTPSPVRKVTATQCTARTKSNIRCARKTTNANGKCWQHQ